MTNFLKRMEPALLSKDPFVQHYAVRILKNSFLATPDTLFTALEAFDSGIKSNFPSSILPHIYFIPVDERGLEELLKRIKNDDENKIWYLKLLGNASTDLLLKYKEELKPFVNESYLENLQEIKKLDAEGLFMELGGIMNDLEDKYNDSVFRLGKRIVQELILRGEIPQWEVENGIRNNLAEHEYMSIEGNYNVFMAGELRTESVIPDLIKILDKNEGDIVLDEVAKALIKIGTDTVIHEVEKVALNKDTCFYSIDVLTKIKTKPAEEALLRLFDQTMDITIKTLIADGLCQHLSVEAIPKVEKLLEDGYDSRMLDLVEPLYVNLILNEINHPGILEMKQYLEQEERRLNERRKQIDNFSMPGKSEKVGRNDPCPCGSGKKYKKCCLK